MINAAPQSSTPHTIAGDALKDLFRIAVQGTETRNTETRNTAIVHRNEERRTRRENINGDSEPVSEDKQEQHVPSISFLLVYYQSQVLFFALL